MLPAIHRAKQLYQLNNCVLFEQDLSDYLRYGYVHVEPNIFIMGRTAFVPRGSTPKTSDDIEFVDRTRANTWFIRMAVGSMADILKTMPFPLKWFAFERRFKKELKIYDMQRMMNKLRGQL